MKLKHIINYPLVSYMICLIASFYLRFLHIAQRWKIVMPEAVEALLAQEKPVIFSFWHGRLLLSPFFCPKHYRTHVVISLHKDGEWIAKIVAFLGVGLIRGSSSKRGMGAVKEIQEILTKPGHAVAITPDGPRGPRMRIGGNIIEMAARAGVPIVPFTCSTSRAKHLKTWDRFLFSKAFGKGVAIFGQPHYIDGSLSQDEKKHMEKKLEDEMIRLTQFADAEMGMAKIFPADQVKQKRKVDDASSSL